MRLDLAIAALLPALALGAPAEMSEQASTPVTCTKPQSAFIELLNPSTPDLTDCVEAIKKIAATDVYTLGSTVTFKTCSVQYNSKGDIDGEALTTVAKEAVAGIISACKSHQGTYTASGPEIIVKKPEVKKE